MPIVEAGLDDLVAGGVAAGQLPSSTRPPRRWRAPSSSSSACPPPRARTGRPTCPTWRRRPRRSAAHLAPGRHRGQQVDGAGRLGHHGRAGDRALGRQRRLQPRVPPRGHRGARQPAPRPHRRGRRRPPARRPWSASCSPRTAAPLIVTDATTSETIKYASNAFLATKLSFVNALAGLCEEVGADARDVLLGLGYDKRIGFEFLRPGPGWGGSCLPKDTRALLHIAGDAGLRLLAAGGRHRVQRASSWTAWSPRSPTACGGAIRRVDGGGVGPHLQGQHRRPAGLAEPRDLPAAWRRSGPPCRRSTRRSIPTPNARRPGRAAS